MKNYKRRNVALAPMAANLQDTGVVVIISLIIIQSDFLTSHVFKLSIIFQCNKVNFLPDMPIVGFSNKEMMSKLWTNGDTII